MNNKLVILSVLALLVCSCGGGAGKSGKGRTENIPVRVMSVSSVQSTETKSYIGTVEASKSSYLRCRHSGTLVSLNVREGDEVERLYRECRRIWDAGQETDGVCGLPKWHSGDPQGRQVEDRARLRDCRAAKTRTARAHGVARNNESDLLHNFHCRDGHFDIELN